MPDFYSFGDWVRRRRKALDMTQEDLALRVGCAVVTIRKIESDARRPSLQIAERLAGCLSVVPAERDRFLRVARAELAVDRLPDPAPEALIAISPPALAALPAAPNPLIGRASEVAEVAALLRHPDTRLVTLTGPGGVGKTRLALAVATMLRAELPGGAAFIPLASLREPALLLATVAQLLGLPEAGGVQPLERLAAALAAHPALLVLDNLEQVLAAAPQLAHLLAAIPSLKLLATSRAALRIQAEREVVVAPLGLPPEADLAADRLGQAGPDDSRAERLGRYPAVQLYAQRAQAARASFALTDENVAAVAAICARVDGLPLAIELAAARAVIFAPAELLARLDRRLEMLTSGPRDLPARQQTLRAAIGWSYELLEPAERELLARLSVFVDGFTLEAAAAVAWPAQPAPALLGALTALADHSLLRVLSDTPGGTRFTMLESIREYAGERLSDGVDEAAVRARHAAYFLGLAERVEPLLFGPEQVAWLDQLGHERGNLRAALEWALDGAQPAAGLRLAGSLWWFWYTRGYLREGRAWLERGMALVGESAAPERARAGYRAAALAFRQGDYQRAAELAAGSLGLCEQLGDPIGAAFARGILGIARLIQGDPGSAEELAGAGLPALRAAGQEWAVAVVLVILGVAARFRGDQPRAEACLDESLALFRQVGDAWGAATALGELGLVEYSRRGDLARAARVFEESLALSRSLGDQDGTAHTLHRLGRVARLQGDWLRARGLLHQQVALFRSLGDRAGIAYALWEAAALAAETEQPEHAAQLFAAADLLSSAIQIAPAPDRAEYERYRERVRAALGEAAFATALRVGRALAPEQALALLRP